MEITNGAESLTNDVNAMVSVSGQHNANVLPDDKNKEDISRLTREFGKNLKDCSSE
jgi:hypothetical protein